MKVTLKKIVILGSSNPKSGLSQQGSRWEVAND